MAIDLANATTEQLKRILEVRLQMDALQNELNQLGAGGPAPATPGPKQRKRHFSRAARQKMAQAQQRRWAARRTAGAAPQQAEAKPDAKARRVMTDEWKAKIAAAQTAQWAKRKGQAAAEKPAAKPGPKKEVSPKLLANLAKARAARWANRTAAK